MTTPKLTIEPPAERKSAGIEDRGRVQLTCADCGKDLIEIIITRNNDDLVKAGAGQVTTKVKCQCRSCGGSSYVADIEGTFCPGVPRDDMSMDVVGEEDGAIVFSAGGKN